MDAALVNPLRPVKGVWCAVLTPFDDAGLPDHARLAQHVRRILAAGVDGIALFGTTGEGQSLSLNERRAGLDALLASGIAPTAWNALGTLDGSICLPLTIIASRPRMMYKVARVTTRLGTRNTVTMSPLIAPKTAPTTTPIAKPTTGAVCG